MALDGVPWLPGEVAALAPVAEMSQVAMSLARFVRALQAIDPAGGPVTKFRGGTLSSRDPVSQASAAALQDSLDVRPVLAAWEAAVAEPQWTGPPVWMHGDLHPANLLVSNGELTGIIDFGLLGVGDPACDLMLAWTYLRAYESGTQSFNDAAAEIRSALDGTWGVLWPEASPTAWKRPRASRGRPSGAPAVKVNARRARLPVAHRGLHRSASPPDRPRARTRGNGLPSHGGSR